MTRRYKVVARNDRTGRDTDLSSSRLTHEEACSIMKRFTIHPSRTVMLVETTHEMEHDAMTTPIENQETITAWTDATFGYKHPLTVAARMNVEVSELLVELLRASYEPGTVPELEKVFAANIAMAEALCELTQNPDAPVSEMIEAELQPIRMECADVLVMLSQVAQKVGGNLTELVDQKMKINRARTWAKVGGRFQHV